MYIKINVARRKTTHKTNILKNYYSTWDISAHKCLLNNNSINKLQLPQSEEVRQRIIYLRI